MSRYYSYESVNIIGGVKGDPQHNIVKNKIKATGTGNVSVSKSQGQGAVHITDAGSEILVNKNKVMVKTADGKIVQVKDGQIQISGKGHVFNNGNTGPTPNPIPDIGSTIQEIINFVNNLLKSIFGPK